MRIELEMMILFIVLLASDGYYVVQANEYNNTTSFSHLFNDIPTLDKPILQIPNNYNWSKRERHLSLISKVVTQIRKFLKRNNKAIVKPPPAIPKLPQLVPVRKLPPAVPKGAIRCKKYALRKCRRIKEREESLICLHEKYTKCMSRLGLPAQDFPPRPPYHVTPLLAKNS